MKVKELDRTVNVAWSPGHFHPIILAAGTAAQQLDASFNTSASLELYSLNLNEPGLDLEVMSSYPCQNRFHKLAWGGSGNGPGVVVGGCDAGRIQIYNVTKLLEKEESLVSHHDRHSGPVKSLDFNPFQANLLASGASESEIFIWDLNNTSTPMTPGAKSQPFEDVVSLAWNRQVQHILASSFTGRCIVWDLRKNEPIIKLTDGNSRVKWRTVCWHPDVATQLCLASEDDSTPVIQLWDLRFATSPLKSFHGHSRGVLSLAWCSQDSDLLISSGKDNRILCWNPNSNQSTEEIQCEIGNTQQWIFELAWCPRNPNLIASCSADSHASVYCLTGSQHQAETTNKIADSFPGMDPLNVEQPASAPQQTVELTKPPKWMRKPVAASFGLGGKLYSCGQGRVVTVSQVVGEATLVDRAKTSLELVRTGQAQELCKGRQDPLWNYLEAVFAPAPSLAIASLLGYPQTPKTPDEPQIDGIIHQMSNMTEEATHIHSNNIDVDFGTKEEETLQQNDIKKPEIIKPIKDFRIPTSSDGDGEICKNLLLGDLDKAVDVCLREDRMADALVLAMVAGPKVLSRTQNKYFSSFKKDSSSEELIRAVVTGEWEGVVRSCHLDSWKETLVAILTYAPEAHLSLLCQELGKRLEEAGQEHSGNAEICYVASGSFPALIRKRISKPSCTSESSIQDLVELVMVGQAAAMSRGQQIVNDGEVADLLSDFALLIASQGDLETALAYIADAHGENAMELRERLRFSLGAKETIQPPQPAPDRHHYQSAASRKYSTHSQDGGNKFNKMSASAAYRANSALTSQPPVGGQPGLNHPYSSAAAPVMGPPPASGYATSAGGLGYPTGASGMSPPSAMPAHPSAANIPGFPPTSSAGHPPSGAFPGFPPSSSAMPGHPSPAVQSAPPLRPPSRPPSHPAPLSSHSPPPTHPPGGMANSGVPGKKYVVDPSVGGGGGSRGSMGGGFMGSGGFQTSFLGGQPTSQFGSQQQPLGAPQFGSQSVLNSTQFGSSQQTAFNPQSAMGQPQFGVQQPVGSAQFGTSPLGGPQPTSVLKPSRPPSTASAQNASIGSPGWNDPPILSSSSRNQNKIDSGVAKPPITHPLLGTDPSSGDGRPPRHFGGPGGQAFPQANQIPPPSQYHQTTPLGQHQQMSPSGQHQQIPPPGQHQQVLSPGQNQQILHSGQHQQMPPSGHHQQALASGRHQQVPSSGQHQQIASSGQHQQVPPSGLHQQVPPLGQHQQVPPLGQHQQVPPLGQHQVSPLGQHQVQPLGQHQQVPHSGKQHIPFSGQRPDEGGQRPPHGLIHQSPPSTTPPNRPSAAPSPAPNQVNGGGYGDPPTPRHMASQGGGEIPLPDNYKPVQECLELLRTSCYNTSNNPQVKRKLDDVARKLELLYDSLRESRLSMETLNSLEELVTQIENGDYSGALSLHTRLISGPDFSQIASFMPGLKVLIQCAIQLNVFLH